MRAIIKSVLVFSMKTSYEKIVNELNREIGSQRSQIQDQHSRIGQTKMDLENAQRASPTKGQRNPSISGGTNLREQLAEKEEQNQKLIRALAEIRADMVNIAEGNLKAMSDEDKQNLSVQALITNKTGQLQERIDDYEGQIQNLKRELKAQKDLVQQYLDEANDARERLGTVDSSQKY